MERKVTCHRGQHKAAGGEPALAGWRAGGDAEEGDNGDKGETMETRGRQGDVVDIFTFA